MVGGTQGLVGLGEVRRRGTRKQAQPPQALQEADIVGPDGQFRVRVGPAQDQVLNHKLDVGNTAPALLEVEATPPALVQALAHLGAHLPHLGAQLLRVALPAEDVPADLGEAREQAAIASQRPGAHQGLVLPGPGLAGLVVGEGAQGAHQQALVAVRAQAHVHLVELAGGGVGGHHVDGPLTHAGIELVVGDGLGPRRHGVGVVAAVEEDQVEIGAIAQFDPPQLAVADDQEAGATLPDPGGRPMALRQVAIGQGDHPVQAGLGDIGEVVADHHQGDDAGKVGGGHPQPVALGELAQTFHLLLQVVRVQGAEEPVQLGLQFRPPQGGIEATGIDQLVQEQGLADDLLADPGAHAGQADQLGEDDGPLHQHGQVGGAPGHGLQHPQNPLQGQVRGHGAGNHRQAQGHELVEALAAAAAEFLAVGRGTEGLQPRPGLLGIGEAGLGQQILCLALVQAPAPEGDIGGLLSGGSGLAGGEDPVELALDPAAVLLQAGVEAGPVRIAHGPGQAQPAEVIGG